MWYILLAAPCRIADGSNCSVKTRIQAASGPSKGKGKDGVPPISITGLLFGIIKQEGIAGYYKGFGASMLNTFSTRMSLLDPWELHIIMGKLRTYSSRGHSTYQNMPISSSTALFAGRIFGGNPRYSLLVPKLRHCLLLPN